LIVEADQLLPHQTILQNELHFTYRIRWYRAYVACQVNFNQHFEWWGHSLWRHFVWSCYTAVRGKVQNFMANPNLSYHVKNKSSSVVLQRKRIVEW